MFVRLCVREQTKSQKTPEDEEGEAADARKEEQASRQENKETVNCTAVARKHSYHQASSTVRIEIHTQLKQRQMYVHLMQQEKIIELMLSSRVSFENLETQISPKHLLISDTVKV